MTTLTETRKPGDLVVHMESMEYCTESKVIKTQAASGVLTDLADVVGYPLILSGSDYKLAKSGDEANVVALIVDGPPIDDLTYLAATTRQYKILTKAPVVINQSRIAATDYAGATFTAATIITALKALGFRCYAEPAKIDTQTE